MADKKSFKITEIVEVIPEEEVEVCGSECESDCGESVEYEEDAFVTSDGVKAADVLQDIADHLSTLNKMMYKMYTVLSKK